MGSPDFETYTSEELFDVERHIDKERYPARYEELQRQIRRRKPGIKPRKVLPDCPICGKELCKTWVRASTGEEITGLLLVFVPVLWVFSFFFGLGYEGFKCTNCDKEFKSSDV